MSRETHLTAARLPALSLAVLVSGEKNDCRRVNILTLTVKFRAGTQDIGLQKNESVESPNRGKQDRKTEH